MTKRLPKSRAADRPASTARSIETHPETEALLRNLDRVYERLRKRARAEWLRLNPDADPSDACVSVRITCGTSNEISISSRTQSRD